MISMAVRYITENTLAVKRTRSIFLLETLAPVELLPIVAVHRRTELKKLTLGRNHGKLVLGRKAGVRGNSRESIMS